MAAGKALWVKLRYRTRPSSGTGLTTGQGFDPTEKEAYIKSPVMSHAFDQPTDVCFIPQSLMTPPLDMSSVAPSIEHGPYSHAHSLPLPPPHMVPLMNSEILSQRKRRKSTSALKRSSSTSNMRSQQQGDGGSLAEKRRNKLGYHRTSIACSHCRRRKIRCLAAPDDPHNRCANCIRLKKECNFFPVDQQPPIERRQRPQTKVDRRGSHSAHSSPALSGPHMVDPHDHLNPFQNIPITSQGYHQSTAAWSTGVVSPMSRAPVDHRGSFDFNQPPQQPGQWHSPFPDAGSMSAGNSSPGDTSQSYWGRHTDSPLTPAYSPHLSTPVTSLPLDSRHSITSFAPARNDSTWSAPARSTSLGIVDEYQSGYQRSSYHPQPLNLDIRRPPSDMHPPSLMTSAPNSSHTSISESSLTPMSAPVSSPPDHWGVPSGWNTLPNSAVTKPTDYSNWYSKPGLEEVQEEDVPPRYGEQPAIVYLDGDHQ